MFRIGFDPFRDAEQRHEEIIKEIQYYRLAKLANAVDKLKTRNNFKLLAQVGKSMATLGMKLAARFGDTREISSGIAQQTNRGECS